MKEAEKVKLLKHNIEVLHNVTIIRSKLDEDYLEAIPLGIGEKLVLLQHLHNFDLDGYSIIRMRDITSVMIRKHEVFSQHILKEEGILDKIRKPAISSLDNWKDVLDELSVGDKNIIVECESLDPPEFYIGKIISINQISLYLLYIDSDGEWNLELTEIPLREITSVSIDSKYITVMSKYVAPRIANGNQLGVYHFEKRTMRLWRIRKWEKTYQNVEVRSGLRLCCESQIDPEVKRACKEFCTWLRSEYYFPIRVPIYLKSTKKIKAMDGDLVYGIFFSPYDKLEEPYIRVAAGDFLELHDKWGKDNALASYLFTIAHELTHYFQWINDLNLTEMGKERQATKYSRYVVHEYAVIKEHP